MEQRYEVRDSNDGQAVLLDTSTGRYVTTGSGALYEAPIDNVRWTAMTMNKTHVLREAKDTPILAEASASTVLDESTDPAPGPRHARVPATDYPRRLGQLEGEIMGLRAEVTGMLAGLALISTAYAEMRAEVAEKRLRDVHARLKEITDRIS
jgi:hypothetical protein